MTLDATGSELLGRLLNGTALRARVIANNVANQNTPGYTRKTVAFEELLQRSMEMGGDPRAVAPQVLEDHTTPARPDGNNVTLESELNAMRENRLLYEAYTTILYGQFELLRAGISGNTR